ncbi:hypothetical protein BGM25_23930 [Bacillus sp. FJAT-29953]|nr:hypothetical protein [Bacillus sp. FJAT-29953]
MRNTKLEKRRRISPKNCYKKAFEYVGAKDHIEGIKLVHGLYEPSFVKGHCGHEWVELPNWIVFDGVLQRFYEKEAYYNFYQIIKHNEYSSSEMYEVGYKNGGNFGPWNNLVWNYVEGKGLQQVAAKQE